MGRVSDNVLCGSGERPVDVSSLFTPTLLNPHYYKCNDGTYNQNAEDGHVTIQVSPPSCALVGCLINRGNPTLQWFTPEFVWRLKL